MGTSGEFPAGFSLEPKNILSMFRAFAGHTLCISRESEAIQPAAAEFVHDRNQFGWSVSGGLLTVRFSQSVTQRKGHAFEGGEIAEGNAIRHLVDPWGLQGHCGIVGLSSFVGEDDELGAPMVWIGFEGDEPLLAQVVDDALHVLAVGPEISRQPRDGLGVIGASDGTKDLPAGAGQAEAGHEAVACRKEQIVKAEDVQGEAGEDLARWCSLDSSAHVSCELHIDIMMSMWIACSIPCKPSLAK